MSKKLQNYLLSSGDPDDEYGLYVMEVDCPHHADDARLAYNYDADTFFHVRNRDFAQFLGTSELTSCKDEFGNVYEGTRLTERIKDAIKAYEEELPGYVKHVLNQPSLDLED